MLPPPPPRFIANARLLMMLLIVRLSLLMIIVCVVELFQIMNDQILSGLIVYYRAAKPFKLIFAMTKL